MTTVHISLGRDDGKDQTAAKGVVEWEPTTRREDGTMVILERGFTVPLVDGEATVTVDPSGLTWCWRVTERTDSGGTVRYVAVPDSATTVEYVDLPDVDPTTLVPWTPADPEAAYQSALDNLDVETAVAAYLALNPISAPVTSVNTKIGDVVLDAADVGADPAGTAAGLVGALAIPDSADDVGAIPEPAVEGASGDVLVTDGAGGRTWATPDAGGVTSVDGQTGDVSLSSTYAALNHAARHATGQPDAITPASIGAQPAGSYAPALGSDDNYVTDAEKAALHSHSNKSALDKVSGINTGDQVLPTWSTIDGKPAVVAAGATQADARAAIGAGTSSLALGTTAGTAKEGNYAPDLSGLAPIAQPRNTQTGTAYTLVASDAGKIVTLDNAAAITVTVPASTITVPEDTVVRVDFLVLGAGVPTFVGSGGMTINADPSLVADAQYAGLSLLLLSATSGVLVGRLATP